MISKQRCEFLLSIVGWDFNVVLIIPLGVEKFPLSEVIAFHSLLRHIILPKKHLAARH